MLGKYYVFFFSILLTSTLFPNPLFADCTRDLMCARFDTRYGGTPANACDEGLDCADNNDRKELCRHFFHQVKTFKGTDTTVDECKTIAVPEVIAKGGHTNHSASVYLITSKYGDDLLSDDKIKAAWKAIRAYTFPMSMCLPTLQDHKAALITNEHNKLETLVAADVRLFAVPKTLYEILLIATPAYFQQPPEHANVGNGNGKPRGRLFKPDISAPNNVCADWDNNYFKKKLVLVRTTNMILAANKAVAGALLKSFDRPLSREGNLDRFKTAARDAIQGVRMPRSSQRNKYQAEFYNLRSGVSRRNEEFIKIIQKEYVSTTKSSFMMYRAVKKNQMKTEYEYFGGKAEQSWAASLFGGWYFDGPTNSGNAACTASYLLRTTSNVMIYMKTPISYFLNKSTTKKSPYHRWWLPPAPVILQLTGFEGTFHPRTNKSSWSDVDGAQNKKKLAKEIFVSRVKYMTPLTGIWDSKRRDGKGVVRKYGE